MLIDYEYYYFNPIRFSKFMDNFQLRYSLSENNTKRHYNYWLENYSGNAYTFYDMQYRRHEILFQKHIEAAYGLDEYPILDPWEVEEIESLRVQEGLAQYRQRAYYESNLAWNQYVQTVPSSHSKDQPIATIDIGESVSDVLDRIFFLADVPGPTLSEINAVWFNSQINNAISEQIRLKYLPYPEYLRTKHWRKVRAAMLLIHRATCQALDCQYAGESWYGNEPDIHVHHLSYTNRGNERYKDLLLLCDDHHKQWHKTPNSFKVVDDIMMEI